MPATATYKTPGVYIAEIPAFPPSVVGVRTAVPIFIGYTEKAEIAGKPVYNMPIPIGSLADFEQVFGRGYKATLNLEKVPESSAKVSFAFSDEPDWAAASADNYDFRVLDPDLSPPDYQYYNITSAGSRGPLSPPHLDDDEAVMVRAYYGDGEIPEQPRFNLYNSLRLFYANGGADGYAVSVGSYEKATNGVELGPLIKGLAAAAEQVGPTIIVVPDAVLLPPAEKTAKEKPWISEDFAKVAQAMIAQARKLGDRVAILDVYGTQYVNASKYEAPLSTVIGQFRQDVGDDGLDYAMAYFPFLNSTVVPLQEVDYTNLYPQEKLRQILTMENENLYPGKDNEVRRDAVQADIDATEEDNPPEVVKRLNDNLVAALPLLKKIELQVVGKMDTLPPSGAMAGVFTRVDQASGVWNAPANVTLASVESPTLLLNNKEQEDLNMPVNGKAVDALRVFPGRGTVVWGARTLDGNSPDYRYIQVRRTLIYIEQSIKAALDPFVFAPNTGQTWATVVSMVSGFLQDVWSKGGLMGATAAEAFTVQCGLGSTMTGKDILDGYMIVQVTLALIRPAEFIEVTFKQTMQGVG